MKKGKKGTTTVNLKDSVDTVGIDSENKEVLHLFMKVGGKGSLKPEAVVDALLELSQGNSGEAELPDRSVSIHRTGLYFRKNGDWVTPLLRRKN